VRGGVVGATAFTVAAVFSPPATTAVSPGP